ncbi:MAG TPA: hypothetical protein VFP84_12985 [Kofleriaceae bacterium]|nr:hypothetical protein [Kofleriaceae bacterium]
MRVSIAVHGDRVDRCHVDGELCMSSRHSGAESDLMLRRAAAAAVIAFATAVSVFASCTFDDEPHTGATEQGLDSGSSGGSSGGGTGSAGATPVGCAPKMVPSPNNASCLTADKTLVNQQVLFAGGQASGDYPIGIGQQGQPPPDAYRSDVCERAWLDCTNGHLLPAEASFCTNQCNGVCAAPSVPFAMMGTTTYTVVPCGSAMCWHITCVDRGCGAQVGCCSGFGGSGAP